ncbi:amidohydrolase family protein [Sphingomonas flavescens]|uniref:amidohydrolase family protein n=1 Tax=Sphingomonas flavescens TaxID=3132797 RepID=UPI002803A2C0|nr:amidohydrolase family protein [Sphingomonas limnosediminicola]
MRRLILAALLSASVPALAAPTPKEQLMQPPAGARHYVLASDAAKHGDIWSWKVPDGSIAYRMSMSLRGWITEEDATVKLGADGRPVAIKIRGYNDEGDATEDFAVDASGKATWKTTSGEASAPFGNKIYDTKGGPRLINENLINVLVAAGEKGVDILPSGRGSVTRGEKTTITGPGGPKTIQLAFVKGLDFNPFPVWLDERGKFFGTAGIISMVPEGYEKNAPKLRDLQDAATAKMVRDLAHQVLTPAARAPTLIDHVLLFDADAGQFLPDRAVLVQNGKIAAVGAGGSLKAPAGATRIDGTGKSLVPGLWDSHQHIGDDWNMVQNVATGIVNVRSPGTVLEKALDIIKRRKAGDLIAPDGKISVIVDRKDPLAAQGALTVSSEAETVAAVDKIAKAGLWGVKFYTSMTPSWIAPGAAEAHKLGLHVHGHVPAGMRPLDAVRAGYDEVTHINFIMMQAMPQSVVDKANTSARLDGPARYGKDVDLDSPAMKAFYAELAQRKTIVDPTLTVWEPLMTSDGTKAPPEYAPYMDVVPASVARGFMIAGYPLGEGLTRDDYRKSFDKMVGLVERLHKAGVRVVAGTDGYGLELVRELELYNQQAGFTPAEAIQSATIVPARMVGMDKTTGSIAPGKDADMILVEGDVSKNLGALRHITTVFNDGYRIDADALRKATGITGMPK